MFTQFIRKRKQEVLDGMLKCGSIIPVIAASLFLAGCEIQIRGIPPWLGLIIFVVMVSILVVDFIAHVRAKKTVKEKMAYGGIDCLIQALKSGEFQDEVIEALGRSKDPRAVSALIDFVNSEEVRKEEDAHRLSMGLNALAETGDPKAVDFLISALSDPDLIVRCYACSALGNKGIKDFRAVEPLIALLKDIKGMKKRRDPLYDAIFEDWVEGTLNVITGKRFGADPEKWEKWWEENKVIYKTK
jgi:hypothetical protein